MLTVIATIRAQAEHADRLQDVMGRLAEASRGEEGCRGYHVFRCAEDASLFLTFEQWTDTGAESRHMTSAHVAAPFAVARPLLAAPLEIRHFSEV